MIKRDLITWKEFKETVERIGVKDEDQIEYIKITGDSEVFEIRTKKRM